MPRVIDPEAVAPHAGGPGAVAFAAWLHQHGTR